MEKEIKSLTQMTANAILEYIKDNNLSVGQKLPNEYTLAEELNVGRSTLREAVRMLASRNILEVRQGSGTYISDKPGIVEDPLGFAFVKDTLKLTEDLFEIRYLIEPKSASLAAMYGEEKDILALEQLSVEIEKGINQENKESLHFQKDFEFHALIAKMSGNVAMSHLIPIIHESIILYNDYYTSDHIKEETITSHKEIVQAIKEKNPSFAYDAMQLHIANNRRSLQKNKGNIK